MLRRYNMNGNICIPERNLIILRDSVLSDAEIESICTYDKNSTLQTDEITSVNKFMTTQVGLFITSACQLKCVYCYYDSNNVAKNNSVITEKQIDCITDKLFESSKIMSYTGSEDKTVRVTISGGGEPTLFWNRFTYLIERLKTLSKSTGIKINISIVTNGALSYDKRQYIANNVDSILVSYDGLPEIQAKQRRSTAEQQQLIEDALSFFSQVHSNYSVRVTVLPENYDKLICICDYLFSTYAGLKQIQFEPVAYSGRGASLSESDDTSFLNSYVEAFNYTKEHYSGKHLYCSLFPQNLQPSICSAWNGRNPWIDADGNLLPCNERLSPDEYSIGKINPNGHLEWYDLKHSKKLVNEDAILHSCASCLAYNYCRGGCPIIFKRNNAGDLVGLSSKRNCSMVRKYWETVYNHIANEQSFMSFEPYVVKRNKDQKALFIKIRGKSE